MTKNVVPLIEPDFVTTRVQSSFAPDPPLVQVPLSTPVHARPEVNFFVLGPLRVAVDGVDVGFSGTKERTVLASLLLFDDHVVDNDRLMQLLWDTTPPATASAQIHAYMSRLRRKLGPQMTISHRSPGYVMQTQNAWTDIHEFIALAELAHQELANVDFVQAARHFRDALALWRGRALPDVTPFLAGRVVPMWEEVRMAALEGRINADLRSGLDAVLVPELTGLVFEHPYREVLRAQLMGSLCLANRQADALAVFREGRRILVREVGVDPGEALTRTHCAVLQRRSRPEVLAACSGVV